MRPFSVLISVYKNDNPVYIRNAIESISIKQTFKPSEVILVVDGPVGSKINQVLTELSEKIHYLKIIRLEKNMGLGHALNIGLSHTSYEFVARMDSDDIATPFRCEKQIKYLSNNKDISIVGGQITEFIGEESNIVSKRIVPCDSKDIEEYIKSRCPFNHMTIMARKSKILEVGNYQELHFNEDYYLWIRMYEQGCKFANLPDTLVNVRVGKEMYARRGGWKYFKSEKWLQDYMLKKHIINLPRYCYNVLGRFGVQVLLPTKVRGLIFKTLFRKS
ncbi:MAG: glycosyltransferase [Muribaculaceae bacterium]|nr:glycosyltransferase [Muribaculaceae bacterium]